MQHGKVTIHETHTENSMLKVSYFTPTDDECFLSRLNFFSATFFLHLSMLDTVVLTNDLHSIWRKPFQKPFQPTTQHGTEKTNP